MQAVPDKLLGWEDSFIVPKQFSQKVMAEISTGSITSLTRRAITQDVAAKCLNYCKYPTMQQLEVVASKIVSTFPVLVDTIGTGHVSVYFYNGNCIYIFMNKLHIGLMDN